MKARLSYTVLAAWIVISVVMPIGAAIPDWVPGKYLLISRSITSWNSTNKSKVSVDLKRSGIFKAKLPADRWESVVLAITGKIANNSDDTLDSVVIDYVISNKKTKTEVIRIRLGIAATVFKTATLEFKNPFKDGPYASNKDKLVLLATVKAAVDQLGGDYQWSYDFVAAIPRSIVEEKGDDAYRALNIDQVLIEADLQN